MHAAVNVKMNSDEESQTGHATLIWTQFECLTLEKQLEGRKHNKPFPQFKKYYYHCAASNNFDKKYHSSLHQGLQTSLVQWHWLKPLQPSLVADF